MRLLPLFLVLGLVRGGMEQKVVRYEQKLELDAETVNATGTLACVEEKGAWTVFLLKQVHTEAGNLRYLQVYLQPDQAETCQIGQQIRASGTCTAFEPASNPGEFDSFSYYRGQKLLWRMFAKQVDVVGARKRGALLANGLWQLRKRSVERLTLLAGAEDGSMFAAMLLGEKSGMPEEIRDLYQKNGIAHLLAVSGLHLSLVSMAAYGLLRKAGAGYGSAALAGGGLLILYSILTGASASVLRALIMTLCGFLAAYLGRTYDLLSAMSLSAGILLWHSPYLIDQAGVQLSFAAVGGIGVAKELEACRLQQGEREQMFALPVCMQLISLPIVLWHFFAYPLYGIFLNLLVVPLTGIVVGTGAIGLLVSLESVLAGRFVVGGGRAVLFWYELCCQWWMKVPGSSFLTGRPKLWQILLYYLFLGIFLWLVCRFQKEILLVPALVLGLLFLHTPAPRGLSVTVLDTGQGDGICIRTKDTVILVDGGSTDQKELGKYRIEPFFKSQGIRRIDLAVVSHGDWDHISGLCWLMEEDTDIQIQKLVLPEVGRGDEVYERLERLCSNQGGEVVWCGRGDSFETAAKNKTVLSLTCLYPEKTGMAAEKGAELDRNEHSLVLQLDYGGFHMLLTGDMSANGEAQLLELLGEEKRAAKRGDVFVLKAAHHGSGSSSTEEFLSWFHPEYTVISCGTKNRYGHPHPDTIKRLLDCNSRILKTTDCGALIWETDGKRVHLEAYKSGKREALASHLRE